VIPVPYTCKRIPYRRQDTQKKNPGRILDFGFIPTRTKKIPIGNSRGNPRHAYTSEKSTKLNLREKKLVLPRKGVPYVAAG